MHFVSVDTGLMLKLSGFNQHLPKYLETLLQVMCEFQINHDGLSTWKQELKAEYHRGFINSQSLIK